MGQPQFLVHLGGGFRVVHLEWKRIGEVQHLETGGHDLDLPGRDLRVMGALGPGADLARDLHHALAAQIRGLSKELGGQVGRVKHRLRAAFAVANINENDPTQVAAGMHPASQGYRFPDVLGA